MRYCNLVSPPVVVVVGVSLSALAWFLLPEDVAVASGISASAQAKVIVTVAITALMSVLIAALFASATSSHDIQLQRESLSRIVVWFKRLTFISATCFVLILILTAIDGGGVVVFLDTMSGRRRFAALEGVTTFVHLSTSAAILMAAAVVCYGWRAIAASGQSVSWWCVLLLILILARALVGGERVAIYYPVIATVAAVMVRSWRPISLKAVAAGIAIVAVVTGLFVLGEYFRSYGVKRSDYGLDEGLWSYGLNRLLVYYGASVNTGGAMLEVVNDGHGHEELFRHTFNPAWKLIALASGREEPAGDIGEMIAWSGLYNPEFNNSWGFAAPFTEGSWVGLVYWAVWGFVATRCWLVARRPEADTASVAIFGLISAGLVEAARVNALGTVHLLVPLAALLVVRRAVRTSPVAITHGDLQWSGNSNVAPNVR